MSKPGTDVLFHEEQKFRRLWIAALVYPGSLCLIVVFGFAMYSQFGQGIPFGREPMPDGVLWFLGAFMILLGAFLIFLFTTMRLLTTVRRDGLYIRYMPFVNRKIDFQSIDLCEVRMYHPLKEYGGWGIRGGRSGRAYNVRGNRGVQLRFKNGTKLMIGSQQADELARAIIEMMRG